MASGIYRITCLIGREIYIGSSVNMGVRLHAHRKLLRGNRHHNTHLQNAWNKHGEDAFRFDVMLCCERNNLLEAEQDALDLAFELYDRQQVYNVARYAAAPTRGMKASEATLEKMRTAQRARGPRSEETKARMRLAQAGRKVSAETCERIRQSKLGRRLGPQSEEHRRKIAEAQIGKYVSPETCRRISEGRKGRGLGRKMSPEAIAKRVASRLANKLKRSATDGR